MVAQALILSLFLGLSAPADRPDAPRVLAFADHLFEAGDYYRSITEYERFIFFYPRDPEVPRARLRIGMAYERGERWRKAEEELRGVIEDYRGRDEGASASWELGETYYKSGQFLRASSQYKKFREDYPRTDLAARAQMRIVWCSLRSGDDAGARRGLEEAGAGISPPAVSRAFLADLDALDGLPTRSPALAGVLSAVVPGTGQFYTGHFIDGTAALLLNAAFIIGAIEAFDHRLYGTFGILVFFETGWYGGNIYSAVSSAYKFNKTRREEVLRDLERKYWEP